MKIRSSKSTIHSVKFQSDGFTKQKTTNLPFQNITIRLIDLTVTLPIGVKQPNWIDGTLLLLLKRSMHW